MRKLNGLRLIVLLALCVAPLQTQAGIVINELLPNPSSFDDDNERVELYNTGPDPVDTTGWAIEDAATIDDPGIRRRIPEDFDANFGVNPIINPGEFRVVRGVGANGAPYLNNGGDTVYLVSNRTGNLAAVVDQVAYGSAPSGLCWANNPDGADPTNFAWRTCTHGVSNCAADATAPAAVTTLAATAGAFDGEVDLTWNAVGNDGNGGGAALLHIVKYNTVPINDGNFDASLNAFNAPLPGSPGTPHSMTVFGLDSAQTYWFALKAEDCQNTSPISTTVPSTQPGTAPLPYFDRTFGLQPFYGNLHSHTSYSDGLLTPAGAYNFARNLAPTPLDFLAVTDHNHTGAGPMTPELYQTGLVEAATANEDGGFVAIYGQEFGFAADGHVNVFEAPVLFGWEAGDYVFVPQDDYPALYSAILDNPSPWGPLAEFCHPGSGDFDSYVLTADGASVMRGIALINGPAFSTATDESDVGNTNFDANFQTALEVGYFVSPYGDQDNHNQTWGASTESRTVVLATALTKDAIMGGIAGRNTYATQDHNVTVDMSVNGWPMGSRFLAEHGGGVHFDVDVSDSDGEGVQKFELFRGVPGASAPTLVATADGVDRFVHRDNESPVPAIDESRIYYLRITQDDNHRIWTAPVQVTFDTQVAVGETRGTPRFSARLYPARPNPFNPGTEIRFHLDGSGTRPVTLRIYDVRGRAVRELVRAELAAGPHAAVWDGRDDERRELSSGVYFARLTGPGSDSSRRLVLLR
jgi:hypothetical protein